MTCSRSGCSVHVPRLAYYQSDLTLATEASGRLAGGRARCSSSLSRLRSTNDLTFKRQSHVPGAHRRHIAPRSTQNWRTTQISGADQPPEHSG
jgi:hypothetical protein